MPKLTDVKGATFRQLDHWVRQGYIKSDGMVYNNAQGWRHREFSHREMVVVQRMVWLVEVGFTPKAAAQVARDTVSAGHKSAVMLSAHVTVQLEV